MLVTCCGDLQHAMTQEPKQGRNHLDFGGSGRVKVASNANIWAKKMLVSPIVTYSTDLHARIMMWQLTTCLNTQTKAGEKSLGNAWILAALGGWKWLQIPTPGQKNMLLSPIVTYSTDLHARIMIWQLTTCHNTQTKAGEKSLGNARILAALGGWKWLQMPTPWRNKMLVSPIVIYSIGLHARNMLWRLTTCHNTRTKAGEKSLGFWRLWEGESGFKCQHLGKKECW
jgi:hypothetical protein